MCLAVSVHRMVYPRLWNEGDWRRSVRLLQRGAAGEASTGWAALQRPRVRSVGMRSEVSYP